MELGVILLYGLAMALGLVGVLVPVIPGLLLVAGVAAVWAYDTGGETSRWVVVGVMVVVLAVGTVAKYVLPGRSLREAGAPRSTLLLGALGAVIGFFVIPVAGLLVGGIAGVYLGEWRRLRDATAARRSTVTTAKAVGVGILVELAAGIVAVGIWLVAALALAA